MSLVAEWRRRARAARDELNAALAGLDEVALERPWVWRGGRVDVRFRLQRFASHERQHTVHLARTRRRVGLALSEAQLLLAQAEVTRGHLLALLVGLPDALARHTPPTGPTIEHLLADLLARDRGRVAALAD